MTDDLFTDEELRVLGTALLLADVDDRVAWCRTLRTAVAAGLSPAEAARRLLDDDPCSDRGARGQLGRL